MAITVGLDFGTHQTKICIENSDDPHRVTYEFWKWADGGYAFPSVIQINKDHTLSYGHVDIDNCLYETKFNIKDAPVLTLPEKPEPPKAPRKRIVPDEPVTVLTDKHGETKTVPLSRMYGIGITVREKSDYSAYRDWKELCDEIEERFHQLYDDWLWLTNNCADFQLPEPTIPVLPDEPFLEGYIYDYDPAYEATRTQIVIYNEWKQKSKRVENANNEALRAYSRDLVFYEAELIDWKEECERLEEEYQRKLDEYNRVTQKYPMIFRYFKQATFSSYLWKYQIRPEQLSVLYLAYIIFQLEERFGNEFSIQMGVPASERTFPKLKKFATGYLIQAYRIVENVFENDFEEFLSTPYEKLLELIPKFEYSDELKFEYGIIVLPEAYAALRSLTVNSRIPRGMSIMIDMGGGTTDMSFFVIEDNGEPHIYHFTSIDKGLNYFLEFETLGKPHDFSVKKELEDLSESIFNEAYRSFKSVVDNDVKNLTGFLHVDTISRGFDKKAFSKAIANRPVIYTGGGCYDNRMRKEVLPFSDVLYINNTMLNIQNVIDEQSIDIPYSIMATAYGLCVSIDSDDIIVSSKEELFAKYEKVDENEDRWSSHREHGMWEE